MNKTMEKEYKWRADELLLNRALLWASSRIGSQSRTIRMESSYFDTADGMLRNKKAALRLRRENERTVCCMKLRGEEESMLRRAVRGTRNAEKLQVQFAGDLVDDVVGSALFRLDVYLAGLHAHLVGGAVVCLGTVNDVGDVVLLTAHLYIQLGCQRRAAAAGGSLGGFAGLALGSRSIGCGSRNFLFRHDA